MGGGEANITTECNLKISTQGWGISRLNLHPFAVHPRLVRKPKVEGRGVRRTERAVVVVRDLEAHRFLRQRTFFGPAWWTTASTLKEERDITQAGPLAERTPEETPCAQAHVSPPHLHLAYVRVGPGYVCSTTSSHTPGARLYLETRGEGTDSPSPPAR